MLWKISLIFTAVASMCRFFVGSTQGASHSFTSFEDKFVWQKMPMRVILSAAKNLPAGWDASLRSA
jgi:hypothetical protein